MLDFRKQAHIVKREVLRREAVRSLYSGVDGRAENRRAVIADRLARDRRGRQYVKLARYFGCDRFSELARRGEQNRGSFDVVLRLGQHIGGYVARIGVFGDD